MTAAVYDTEIEQGATFQLSLTWRDENSNLVNLTGYTARMQVRAVITDTTPLLDLTTTNGAIVLGGALGTIAVTASAAQTAALTAPSKGVYDLELVSPSGFVTRLLKGHVKITPEVTR
jgi:hypothetical protein